jgi:hypothetical protein
MGQVIMLERLQLSDICFWPGHKLLFWEFAKPYLLADWVLEQKPFLIAAIQSNHKD